MAPNDPFRCFSNKTPLGAGVENTDANNDEAFATYQRVLVLHLKGRLVASVLQVLQ